MDRPRRAIVSLVALALGCGGPAPVDAGSDAGALGDAGADAGPDAGPPPTGCDLWTGDAGAPGDAGPLPAPCRLPAPGRSRRARGGVRGERALRALRLPAERRDG
ncbi:MAG: hypothetical protein M5U28_50435 [Sandaracinaceae bacterium]|nr:hypothetical protein [Sandaracinaceae bacterium]